MQVNAIKFAEDADLREVIWTYTFVIWSNKTHVRFVSALDRLRSKNIKDVELNVKVAQAMLNIAYEVKVTAPGRKVALIIKYFMACGF